MPSLDGSHESVLWMRSLDPHQPVLQRRTGNWNPSRRADDQNYGLDRVRFPGSVPVGSRIRAAFEVESVHEIEGGIQAAFVSRVERDGAEKPVCVATVIFRFLR